MAWWELDPGRSIWRLCRNAWTSSFPEKAHIFCGCSCGSNWDPLLILLPGYAVPWRDWKWVECVCSLVAGAVVTSWHDNTSALWLVYIRFGTLTGAWVHGMSMVPSMPNIHIFDWSVFGGEAGDWTSRALRRLEKDGEGKFWKWMTLTGNVESPYKEDDSNLCVDALVGSPTGTP